MRVGGVGVVAPTWAWSVPPAYRQAGPPTLEVSWGIRGTPPETPGREGFSLPALSLGGWGMVRCDGTGLRPCLFVL